MPEVVELRQEDVPVPAHTPGLFTGRDEFLLQVIDPSFQLGESGAEGFVLFRCPVKHSIRLFEDSILAFSGVSVEGYPRRNGTTGCGRESTHEGYQCSRFDDFPSLRFSV